MTWASIEYLSPMRIRYDVSATANALNRRVQHKNFSRLMRTLA